MQKHKLHTTLLVLCILYSQVSTTTGNGNARVIPGVIYTNNAWACKEPFHQLDFHEADGDNGTCGCERYCASNWGYRLSGRGWRGATNMILGSVGNCMCVEAKEHGWCDIDTLACEDKCHAGHNFSAGNPCKPYPNLCPTTHNIRYLEPRSDLYYCMNKHANICSINASKQGPDGPGSAWGSVHKPCIFPEDSSPCSSSWPDGAIATTVILAFLAVGAALTPFLTPFVRRWWKSLHQLAQEPTDIIESVGGQQVNLENQSLFSYL